MQANIGETIFGVCCGRIEDLGVRHIRNLGEQQLYAIVHPDREAGPALEPDLEEFPELAELPDLPTNSPKPAEDPDRFRVLVVDADPDQLTRVQKCLGTWSYDIEQA